MSSRHCNQEQAAQANVLKSEQPQVAHTWPLGSRQVELGLQLRLRSELFVMEPERSVSLAPWCAVRGHAS